MPCVGTSKAGGAIPNKASATKRGALRAVLRAFTDHPSLLYYPSRARVGRHVASWRPWRDLNSGMRWARDSAPPHVEREEAFGIPSSSSWGLMEEVGVLSREVGLTSPGMEEENLEGEGPPSEGMEGEEGLYARVYKGEPTPHHTCTPLHKAMDQLPEELLEALDGPTRPPREGTNVPEIIRKKKREPTAGQNRLLAWLSSPKGERAPQTLEDLAKELGVKPKTLQRWRTKLDLDAAAAEGARRRLLESLPTVYRVLARKAEEGSQEHIQLYLGVAPRTPPRESA